MPWNRWIHSFCPPGLDCKHFEYTACTETKRSHSNVMVFRDEHLDIPRIIASLFNPKHVVFRKSALCKCCKIFSGCHNCQFSPHCYFALELLEHHLRDTVQSATTYDRLHPFVALMTEMAGACIMRTVELFSSRQFESFIELECKRSLNAVFRTVWTYAARIEWVILNCLVYRCWEAVYICFLDMFHCNLYGRTPRILLFCEEAIVQSSILWGKHKETWQRQQFDLNQYHVAKNKLSKILTAFHNITSSVQRSRDVSPAPSLSRSQVQMIFWWTKKAAQDNTW